MGNDGSAAWAFSQLGVVEVNKRHCLHATSATIFPSTPPFQYPICGSRKWLVADLDAVLYATCSKQELLVAGRDASSVPLAEAASCRCLGLIPRVLFVLAGRPQRAPCS